MRLLLFILLFIPFIAFSQGPTYGAAVGYVSGVPTYTPNIAQKGSELCVSINNKMLYLWNRDSSEWKPLGGITVSFGVPSTAPAAASGTRTAINMQTGLIYWWNGTVWKEIIAYSVELARANLIDSLARTGWVSWVDLAQAVKDSINAGGSGGSPTGAAGGDLTGTYPNPTVGNDKIISANVLDGTLVNADLASQTVDSNKVKNRGIPLLKLGASGANNGQIPTYNSITGNWEAKGTTKVYNVKDYGAKGDGVTIDRQKIQNAIDSCFANGGGDVYFPNGIYNLGDTVVTNTWQGVNPNSQLYIPFDIIDATTPAKIDSSQKRRMIRLLGEFTQNTLTPIYFESGVAQFDNMPPHRSGVILLSKHNNTVSAAAATKPPAVIGSIGRTDAFGSFNWGNVFIENIRVRVTVDTTLDYPKMIGIDASNIVRVHIKNSVVDIDVRSLTLANPPDYASYGVVMPRINCDVEQNVEAVNVIGFWAGIVTGEHTKISSIGVYNAINAILVPLCTHSVLIENARLQGSKYQIAALQANIFSGQITTGVARIKGNIINVERNIAQAPTSYNYTTFVNDPSNRLYANINYHIVTSNVGVTNLQFNKNGGTNVVADSLGSAGSSGSYLNGGNSFGANATIGLNDAYDLSIETTNTARLSIISDGSLKWFGGNSGERMLWLKGGFTEGTFPAVMSDAALNSGQTDGVNYTKTFKNLWLRPTDIGVLISPAGTGILPTAQISLSVTSGSTKDALDVYHSTTKRFALSSYGSIARGSGISNSRVNLLNLYNEAGTRQIMSLDSFGVFKVISMDATDNRGFYLQQHSADANGSIFRFLKSRGTVSSPSAVLNNDFLGSITWTPRGSTYSAGIAYMGAVVTGSPSGDNIPISVFFKSGTSSAGNPNLLLHSNGNVAVGDFGAAGSFTTPTAKLHLAAGTATANTAPFKLTSGTFTSTAETGAIEFASSRLTFTPASTRHDVLLIPSTEQPSVAAGTKANVLYTGSGSANAATYSYFQNGLFAGTTDSNGDIQVVFPSALSDATYSILVTIAGTTLYSCTAHTKSTGGVYIRCFNSSGTVLGAGVNIDLNYEARDY